MLLGVFMVRMEAGIVELWDLVLAFALCNQEDSRVLVNRKFCFLSTAN